MIFSCSASDFLSKIGWVQGYGESCDHFSFLCYNKWSAARIYLGTYIWTVPFSQYQWSDIPIHNFPSRTIGALYLYYSSGLRFRACYFPEYFTPKLSTTKVKLIGRLSCVHIPGGFIEGWYPYGSSWWKRLSCPIRPACGSPYITLVPRENVYLFLTLSLRLYAIMGSCGIMYIGIIIYAALSIQLLKYNYWRPCTYIMVLCCRWRCLHAVSLRLNMMWV